MERNELTLTLEDHQKAFTEISFLVEMMVRTVGDVVGKSSGSLGVTAGRYMGKKLPVHLVDPTPDAVLTALAQRMNDGFEISHSIMEGGADLTVGRCVVREICRQRDLELGGDLCRMFHSYLGGMTAELLGGRPTRATDAAAGDSSCTFHLDIR